MLAWVRQESERGGRKQASPDRRRHEAGRQAAEGRRTALPAEADRTVRVPQIAVKNCRQVTNHMRKPSGPVIGFSRRETIRFEVRLVRIASLAFGKFFPYESRPTHRSFDALASPNQGNPRHGRPPCNARVTAELHMQARRSRTSFAGQRHAAHPSAMARRAIAALYEGDSSARSFPSSTSPLPP